VFWSVAVVAKIMVTISRVNEVVLYFSFLSSLYSRYMFSQCAWGVIHALIDFGDWENLGHVWD
jgi:hypothetical protein